MLKYIPYVLMFAVAAMILYGWGIYRQMCKQGDLSRMLLSKGVSAVRKYLKQSGEGTRQDLIGCISGLSAGLPFSRDKLSVTEPSKFLDSVLKYMEDQRMLRSEKRKGKFVYFLEHKK